MSLLKRKDDLIGSGVILDEIFKEAQKLSFVENGGVVSIPEQYAGNTVYCKHI